MHGFRKTLPLNLHDVGSMLSPGAAQQLSTTGLTSLEFGPSSIGIKLEMQDWQVLLGMGTIGDHCPVGKQLRFCARTVLLVNHHTSDGSWDRHS